MKDHNSKECKDEIRELLPWYLNRTLSEEEIRKVEEHLKGCSRCQRELKELSWLYSGIAQVGKAEKSFHIESDKLVLFAEEPEKLSQEQLTSIKEHLQSCPLCYEQLQTLRNVNLELEEQEKKKLKFIKELSVFEKIGERLFWLLRKPAFAYVIVVLLAYPAARWLFAPSELQILIPKVAPEKVYVLSEQNRITAEPISVFRNKEDKLVRIGIPFWPDLDNYSYEFVIKNESGESIFTSRGFTDFGEQGFFQLALNPDSFSDGSYVLTIKEIDKKNPEVFSETNFPFRIVENN